MTNQRAISRAQLPLRLASVNGVLFAQLLFEWFGLTLDEEIKRWFALDGKELRGSIQTDHTRGEVCVSALTHDAQEIANQAYYNGAKESERPTVRQLLNETGLYNQKLTLDALQLIRLTLKAIHGADGVYVVGLKSNQAHLYRYCICSGLITKRTTNEAKRCTPAWAWPNRPTPLLLFACQLVRCSCPVERCWHQHVNSSEANPPGLRW